MNEEPDHEQLQTPVLDLRDAVNAIKEAAKNATNSMTGFADALSPRPPALNRKGRRAAAKMARRKRGT